MRGARERGRLSSCSTTLCLHDDARFAKIAAHLDLTGMRNFTAWVHGDAIARRFGATPVGLPTGAGYAAGNRLVDAYLGATGQRASQALLASRDDVLRHALDRAER